MIKNYDNFTRELDGRIKSDDEFFYELLITVIKNPERYTGIFRISNARTKLIQNVTQSREIKFGGFMEDIITWYISAMGFENVAKNITDDLEADQLFMMNDKVCLIEQKIRDDHDSTKKRGQYDNFSRKYTALKEKYPGREIIAVMWFIDDSLRKNRKYYTERAKAESLLGVNIHVLYGGELFTEVFSRLKLCLYLSHGKILRSFSLLGA